MTSRPAVPTRWSSPAVPTIVATRPWQVGWLAAWAGAPGTQSRAAARAVVRIALMAGVMPPDGVWFAGRFVAMDATPSQPSLREPSQRVSPRARLMWTTEALMSVAVPVVAAVVLLGPVDLWDAPWFAWVLFLAALAAYVVVVPRWRYLVHRWEVTETAVYTQTGWWARERRIAPMSRIQTVDHLEGALARLFGLATVTVTTASAAGALEIAGLDKDVARRLVDELTVKADAVEGDAT